MDCIFCKLINGDKPCLKVYEDEHTIVFMDKARDVDGHMVAITKKHFENILDSDVDTLNHLMFAVKKVANHCVDVCGYEGINLLSTNGKSADQCVPHFHMHIIPRCSNDKVEAWPEFGGAKCAIEEIYERIRIK
ncbi:MAG: HIT domain-containing protein [Lachnospiraceae bacterium]|nr:HIT domain-containing protein [Lachnospiraceae bacterium]